MKDANAGLHAIGGFSGEKKRYIFHIKIMVTTYFIQKLLAFFIPVIKNQNKVDSREQSDIPKSILSTTDSELHLDTLLRATVS